MTINQAVKPVDAIQELKPYQAEPTDDRILLKLDANEGPAVEMDWSFEIAQQLRRYPDRSGLESKLAERFGIGKEQVLVTAGGDDAIDRVCRAFLSGDRNIVLPEPSFEMIRKYAQMVGSEVRVVEWKTEFPVQAVKQSVDENTKVISIVSPNNPTGLTVSSEELRQLGKQFPNVLLLVDQAYAEFEDTAPGDSLTSIVLNEFPNGIVIRSFSKAWGLAGLRVGYALGSANLIDTLKRVGSPYSVSGLSLSAVEKLLDNQPDGNVEYVTQVRKERMELKELFAETNCNAFASQGNFVYVDFSGSNFDAQFVHSALAAQGILVRRVSRQNAVRITCPGDTEAFGFLKEILSNVLYPEAVIFDMDGVLVDENPSYREAIRLTCESFGESITAEEIAEQKLCGDANNDWIFTQRLLKDRGHELEFQTVKDRFEKIYQGDGDTPGVWDREIRLVDREWLESLSRRFPLAIVTGRPRNDAERFLRNEKLDTFFATVICMEDGPRKPDPSNVRLAMQTLGVRRIWMIGDTPDDIGAAKAAGQVAIGIVAPADDRNFAEEKLKQAMASKIVNNLDEFGKLLPC